MESVTSGFDDDYSTTLEDSSAFTQADESFESLVSRDIRSFRMRYLCSQPYSSYCQYRKRRMLSGKAVYLMLVLTFLERLAYWGALGNIIPAFLEITHLSSAKQNFIRSIAQNIIAQLMYPLAGWISDVWVGRHKAMRGSLWCLLIGYSLLAFSFSFDGSGDPADSYDRYLLPVCFVIISIGAAGFQANVIPFGADQIMYTASEQLSSYFYWYYWVRNLAGITYVLSLSCSNLDPKMRVIMFAMLSSASIVLALVLDVILKNWLYIDPERRNPLKTVAKVLYFSATVKRPWERSAFSFTGHNAPTRIDLAKMRHGGKFTNEQVEDVKTFLRLLVVLASISGVLVIYTGITSVAAIQVNHMASSFLRLNLGVCVLSDSAVWTINVITILAAIPLMNQVIFPCLREYTPSMLKRIGIGYILALSSPLLLLIYEAVGHNQGGISENAADLCMFVNEAALKSDGLKLNSWLMLLPYTAINLTEVFIFVSSLEFLYAQSPHTMRGLMIGLFFFIQGLSATLAGMILFIFSEEDAMERVDVKHSGESCGFWYYLIFFVIAVVTFVLYIGVSKWYKNRQRGDLEESEAYYRPDLTSLQTIAQSGKAVL